MPNVDETAVTAAQSVERNDHEAISDLNLTMLRGLEAIRVGGYDASDQTGFVVASLEAVSLAPTMPSACRLPVRLQVKGTHLFDPSSRPAPTNDFAVCVTVLAQRGHFATSGPPRIVGSELV